LLFKILKMEIIDLFSNPNAWIALLTLTFLEIVLGIDNIVFISIVSNKLKESERSKARNVGLILAMLFRIALLFGISWVLSLQTVILELNWSWLYAGVTGQSIIIILGGIFLLYKSVTEIHHKLEDYEEGKAESKNFISLQSAIIQIALLNLVFSFDSILTAIGLVPLSAPPVGFGEFGGIVIMMLSVIISIVIMLTFAAPVSKFVNDHPTIQILGLSFLILIGVMLLAEGSHLAHIKAFGEVEVTNIPKGYLYFAIFFSLFVEFLNIRMKKKSKPIKLRNSTLMDTDPETKEID